MWPPPAIPALAEGQLPKVPLARAAVGEVGQELLVMDLANGVLMLRALPSTEPAPKVEEGGLFSKAKEKFNKLMGKGGPKIQVRMMPLHFMLAVESLASLTEASSEEKKHEEVAAGEGGADGETKEDEAAGGVVNSALWFHTQEAGGPLEKWKALLTEEERRRCLVCLHKSNTNGSWCWAVVLSEEAECQRW